MGLAVKHRVTITLDPDLLEAVDRAPGDNRSEKIEQLLQEALTGRRHRRWVAELRAFYHAGVEPADRAEDVEWQRLAAEAFDRSD